MQGCWEGRLGCACSLSSGVSGCRQSMNGCEVSTFTAWAQDLLVAGEESLISLHCSKTCTVAATVPGRVRPQPLQSGAHIISSLHPLLLMKGSSQNWWEAHLAFLGCQLLCHTGVDSTTFPFLSPILCCCISAVSDAGPGL